MAKVTKEEFLADVMHEIEMLKKHATPEEIKNLNFDSFDPDHQNKCIYGQLTGNCQSERANQLMDLAAIRQMDTKSEKYYNDGTAALNGEPFSKVSKFVNGAYDKRTWKNDERDWDYLSALEGYIPLRGSNTKGIIQYLKGEIKDLKL